MLKRVNIHISEAHLKELDDIAKRIIKAEDHNWWTRGITRADLIRYALATTFGFEFDNIHTNADILKKALKKAVKNTA